MVARGELRDDTLGSRRISPVRPERSVLRQAQDDRRFDGFMRDSDPPRCSGRTDIDLVCASLVIHRIDSLLDLSAFEALLAEPGPWVGAFDLPFGLPRELVNVLGWPTTWRELVLHTHDIGKDAFKDALNRVRESRPMGARYIPRRGDVLAGASSPMKLVNPPVGLMFFEGAPRIARSGVSVVPCASTADSRVALEGYPGFLARHFIKTSYKKDGPEGRSGARTRNREIIVNGLSVGSSFTQGLGVEIPELLRLLCIEDGSGDALDAVLCAVQAAMALRVCHMGDARYGIPNSADPFEGWIATVPDFTFAVIKKADSAEIIR